MSISRPAEGFWHGDIGAGGGGAGSIWQTASIHRVANQAMNVGFTRIGFDQLDFEIMSGAQASCVDLVNNGFLLPADYNGLSVAVQIVVHAFWDTTGGLDPCDTVEGDVYIVKNANTVPGNYIALDFRQGIHGSCSITSLAAVWDNATGGDFYRFFGSESDPGGCQLLGGYPETHAEISIVGAV